METFQGSDYPRNFSRFLREGLGLHLLFRTVIFNTYDKTRKKDVKICMQDAMKKLQLHEDCVDDFILLKGKYDIEDVQEVQVVSNEDNEALLDNEEIGDEEMGIALLGNEGNGDERIVSE